VNKDEIDEEVSERATRRADSPRLMRNWLLTGEALQLAAILAAIVISYTKSQAAIEENRAAIQQQATLIVQLHESLDQLRMSRAATPEAASRIGVLEVRLNETETRLLRIEEKIDHLIAMGTRGDVR